MVDFPIKNGDFPIKNGDFPIKNGDFPIKNSDFLCLPGRVSYANLWDSSHENHPQPRSAMDVSGTDSVLAWPMAGPSWRMERNTEFAKVTRGSSWDMTVNNDYILLVNYINYDHILWLMMVNLIINHHYSMIVFING